MRYASTGCSVAPTSPASANVVALVKASACASSPCRRSNARAASRRGSGAAQ
ncbi:hypothetical protein ABE504_11950 [Paenibacillus oryzisoli]|uniref:hypothetical protein n=1 Tax=Paenibacillus oryzisoli TaxID=1850517 RepID=UPI003D2948F5